MVLVDKKTDNTNEKEWENPKAPEKSSDDRDKEQIIRQFKEAKRRKDNLSETDDTDKETKTE